MDYKEKHILIIHIRDDSNGRKKIPLHYLSRWKNSYKLEKIKHEKTEKFYLSHNTVAFPAKHNRITKSR